MSINDFSRPKSQNLDAAARFAGAGGGRLGQRESLAERSLRRL